MSEIRLGDCLHRATGLPSLAAGAVDVTITDPPFDARTHRAAVEASRRRAGRQIDGELPFPPLDDAMIGQIAAELARVTAR